MEEPKVQCLDDEKNVLLGEKLLHDKQHVARCIDDAGITVSATSSKLHHATSAKLV
jgi:hypothetical protein